jgi:peptide/nickel transport system permease protein
MRLLGALLLGVLALLAFGPAGLALTGQVTLDAFPKDSSVPLAPGTFVPPLLPAYLLGKDPLGGDLLVQVLGGLRRSITAGAAALALAMLIGIPLGLLAGQTSGAASRLVLRLAAWQTPFPPLVLALLGIGVSVAIIPTARPASAGTVLMVIMIGLSRWPGYATLICRAIRHETRQPYADAARLLGVPEAGILVRHILPNAIAPALALVWTNAGLCIADEAILSYAGAGFSPARPSLGTLIRLGQSQDFAAQPLWLLLPCLLLTLVLAGVWLMANAAGRPR